MNGKNETLINNLKKEIYCYIGQVNQKNFSTKYKGLENIIFSYKEILPKKNVIIILYHVYREFIDTDFAKAEVLEDVFCRLIGDCHTADAIDWEIDKNKELKKLILNIYLKYYQNK